VRPGEHIALGAAAFVVLATGCENSGPSRDFERMVNQAYYQYYEESEFFPDRRAMREPPEGTLPADNMVLPPAVERGIVDGSFVEKNPVLLTTEFVEMGQRRFDVYCAPCHGVTGNGVSVVARKMALRQPPSLVSERVRQFPDGRIFGVITQGYGLMPQYSQELGVIERWAVVAYVRALGLRDAGIPLDRLPQPLRLKAEETLQ
jgi:mono/diheme cytochrome c family protein